MIATDVRNYWYRLPFMTSSLNNVSYAISIEYNINPSVEIILFQYSSNHNVICLENEWHGFVPRRFVFVNTPNCQIIKIRMRKCIFNCTDLHFSHNFSYIFFYPYCVCLRGVGVSVSIPSGYASSWDWVICEGMAGHPNPYHHNLMSINITRCV